jgi:hypothetical protein
MEDEPTAEPNQSRVQPVDWIAEEKYRQDHHHSQPHAREGTNFEHFAPAYRVGAEAATKYPGKEFDEIEDEAAR